MAHIEPKLPGGFRDYLPEDMVPRQALIDTVRRVFERYGFAPLDTANVERTDVLTGGDPHFKKQIYGVASQGGDENELSLRFDLTVPLARAVAANISGIKRPFKRYECGKVWRGERPQAGRYREFLQCDADIVGARSRIADAEIIALMNAVMNELGISGFLIRVNNRKILNGLPEYAGFDTWKIEPVLRALDKLDKLSWDEVAKELKSEKGAFLDDEAVGKIKHFVGVKKHSAKETLEEIEKLTKGIASAEQGVNELKEVTEYVARLGVPETAWAIDPSVARGLSYYTGTIFETVLTGLPNIGSVFSGGRYDNLVERFGGMSIPAVGASVGIDRLFAAMEQLGLIKRKKTVTEVMALNIDESCTRDLLEIVHELRTQNIRAELYAGDERNLKAQLSYAVSTEIPIVLIMGSPEREKKVVIVKDMEKRTQEEVKRKELAAKIRGLRAV